MEQELSNEIILERQNNSELKVSVEHDMHTNNVEISNITSTRNNPIEESKEICNIEMSNINSN